MSAAAFASFSPSSRVWRSVRSQRFCFGSFEGSLARFPLHTMKPNKCPTCRREGSWFETPHGPFCSKRCKLVDLGKWFGEENKISEPLRPDHLDSYADLPPGEDLDQADRP